MNVKNKVQIIYSLKYCFTLAHKFADIKPTLL